MTGKRFWVVGGEYADSRFDRMADGGSEKRHGPFDDYAAARAEWQARAWATVDQALARYRIEEELSRTAMAGYWVVGGVYADTTFGAMEDGGSEKRYGPFATYEQAKKEWQARAWSSVDDALARFRIEKISQGES